MSRRMFNNSVMMAVETGVLTIMVLVATPVLIKNFGVAGYGAFVFLNIFSIYGALYFFDLGMEASLTTYVARYDAAREQEKMHHALVVAVLYYGLLGSAVGVALYFASDAIGSRFIDTGDELNRQAVRNALTIISVNIVLQFLVLPFVAILQGLRRYVVTKSVNTAATVVQYTVIMLATARWGGIDTAFAIVTVVTLLRLVFYVTFFSFGVPQFAGFRPKLDMSLFRVLVGYSSVLFICRIIGLINKNIDKFLIWLFLPVTNLAVYDVIARPSNLLRVPEGVVGISIIPETAHLRELGKKQEIGALYLRLVRYTYLILVPLATVIGAFIPDLIRVWVGSEFVAHSYLVLILLAAFVIAPAPSLAFNVIVGLEKIKHALWISVAATALNAVLSVILLQFLGLAGLLISTLAGQAFMVVPYVRKLSEYTGLELSDLGKAIARIMLLVLPFVAVDVVIRYFLRDHVVTMFGVAALLTLVHLWLEFRLLLDRNERAFLLDRLRFRRSGTAVK